MTEGSRAGRDHGYPTIAWRWAWQAFGWIWAVPRPRHPITEADRLIRRWGDLAPDVARAMASRETAGLFDAADEGFWNDVAVEIERRRPGQDPC